MTSISDCNELRTEQINEVNIQNSGKASDNKIELKLTKQVSQMNANQKVL